MRIIKQTVEELFSHLQCWAAAGEVFFEDPVFGGEYVIDDLPAQKEIAERALIAREWFFLHGPSDAPPLPLNFSERCDIKYRTPMSHLVAQFCDSLRNQGWDVNGHPPFDRYARGVMASPLAADIVRKDQTMLKRYPPQKLNYIHPGMLWQVGPWRKNI
jgi:hypothetical protein